MTNPGDPRPAAPARPQRPDASMTLLTEMMERPLDPSYAAEAARREAAGKSPSVYRPWRLAVAAFLIGLLLITAAKVLREPNDAVAGQKAALISQIESRQQAADALAKRQAALRRDIQAAQAAVLDDAARDDLANRLATAQQAAGTTAVHGPGLELTIDDAKRAAGAAADGDPRATQGADAGTVLATDIQLVVNGLWSAGAEAISINGQRLTSTSAIRFAGDAILVDYRPLARPYVVTAIGDGAAFEKAFVASDGGTYVQQLSDDNGIVYERSLKEDVTCPAGSPYQLRVARTSAPASPATTSPSSASSSTTPSDTETSS